MGSRRSTRAASGSSTGGGHGDATKSRSGDMVCHPIAETEESILLDAKDLLEMLGNSSTAEGDEEDEEGEEEDGEERDLVMDLDARFKSADMKRKFTETLATVDNATVLPVAGDSGSVAVHPLVQGDTATAVPKHIKTVLRVRPVAADAGQLSLTVVDSTTVMTSKPKATMRRAGLSSSARAYTYARVMDESAQQESVFEETAKPLVEGMFAEAGKSGLVMAYGATNAGKTHTIMGARDNDGLLPRTLAAVYQRVGEAHGGGRGVDEGDALPPRVSLRVVEIYTNKAYDLLWDGPDRGQQPLSFKQLQEGEDKIEGLSDHHPPDLAAALELVRQARDRAQISATALNATSSRGHTVWMIELEGRDDARIAAAAGVSSRVFPRSASRNPMLWIVDLAGSERIHRSMSNCRETFNINSDISDLFRCFKQVEAGDQHVTYRTRTLTRMLKRMLVREAGSASPRMRCVMVISVNPAESEYGETEKVLKNALISMKARVVEERPRVGHGTESATYGLNGHLISKRLKSSHRESEGDGPAGRALSVSGKEPERKLALAIRPRGGSAGTFHPSALQEEQAMVIDEQARQIGRLEGEVARLQEEVEEVQEEAWHQAQAELFPQIDGLEKALAEARERESNLHRKLERQDPVGAATRAAVVQSARKQAVRQAKTISTQLTQNIQEAEDESRREAEKRTLAEETLAAAISERDAQAARTAQVLADRAADQAAASEKLAQSRAEAERLEAERARVARALADESARVTQLTAESAVLKDQLGVAMAEMARLQDVLALEEAEVSTVQMNVSVASECVLDSETQRSTGDSGVSLFESSGKRCSASSGKRRSGRRRDNSSGGSAGDADRSADEAVLLKTRTTQAQSRNSCARIADEGEEEEEDRGVENPATRPRAASADNGSGSCDGAGDAVIRSSLDGSDENVDVKSSCGDEPINRGEEGGDSEKKQAVTSPEAPVGDGSPLAEGTEGGNGKGEERGKGASVPDGKRTMRSLRLRLRTRKPLGNLQPTGVAGNAGNKKAATAALQGKGGKRLKGAGVEKAEHEKQERAEKAARSREETRRCKAAREEAMLSKPSPVVIKLSKKQGEIVDRANNIVKARRSGRRRG